MNSSSLSIYKEYQTFFGKIQFSKNLMMEETWYVTLLHGTFMMAKILGAQIIITKIFNQFKYLSA